MPPAAKGPEALWNPHLSRDALAIFRRAVGQSPTARRLSGVQGAACPLAAGGIPRSRRRDIEPS